MDNERVYFDVCLIFMVAFALIFLVSLHGFFYGLNEGSPKYIWAGGILSFIALAGEVVTVRFFIILLRKGKKAKNLRVRKRDQD